MYLQRVTAQSLLDSFLIHLATSILLGHVRIPEAEIHQSNKPQLSDADIWMWLPILLHIKAKRENVIYLII